MNTIKAFMTLMNADQAKGQKKKKASRQKTETPKAKKGSPAAAQDTAVQATLAAQLESCPAELQPLSPNDIRCAYSQP